MGISLNRRQFLGASAMLAVALGMGSTCAFADEKPSAGDFSGPFVVGFDQDFPPYGYVGNDGAFTGFDLDLAAAVCKLEGWEIQLEPIAWDAKDALLNSGQITCIWNGFTIEGREADYAFTPAYMENRQVIVVRSNSDIKDFAGLAGKVVLAQADSAALGLLSEGGDHEDLAKTFAELQTIGEYNTAFMMLETGSVDAVALDYPVAVFQIGDRTNDYAILEEPLNSEHYGVGFAKGNGALAALVEHDLVQLYTDGTVKELCEKYADQGVSYDAWCLGGGQAAAPESPEAVSADVPERQEHMAMDDDIDDPGLYEDYVNNMGPQPIIFRDGKYTAEAKGIGGKVPVTVIIKDGRVAEVTVGDNCETRGIGSRAIEQLPEKIVEANGIEGVEGISGATVTSNAIFEAVKTALELAR